MQPPSDWPKGAVSPRGEPPNQRQTLPFQLDAMAMLVVSSLVCQIVRIPRGDRGYPGW